MVGLHADRQKLAVAAQLRIRIETVVQRAVRVQPGESVADPAVQLSENSADEQAAVAVRGHCADVPVTAGDWIEGVVERTVRIQPGDIDPVNPIDLRKRATDDNPAVGQENSRFDTAVDAQGRGLVNGSIRIEPDQSAY